MSSTDVYVFLSGDGKTFVLSVDADGRNLPCSRYVPREFYMTPNFIGRYAPHTTLAHANLIMHGYHLVPAYDHPQACGASRNRRLDRGMLT